MSNIPMNIWVLKEEEFDEFACTGGKVIYIAEDVPQIYASHPAIITAGALLPPIEAIQAELDGNIIAAIVQYETYLCSEEADPFVSIIVAAAINKIPVGIMFGRDESNMQFPKMFIDFVYKKYGLVFGIKNVIQPYIEEAAMPSNLAKLYFMNIIDYPTFMTKHPKLPIDVNILSKLAFDTNPPIKERTLEACAEYFNMIKDKIIENGGRYLIDPLEGI